MNHSKRTFWNITGGTDFSESPWRNGLFGTSLEERIFWNVPGGTDFSERPWRTSLEVNG
ncbi:hypothetical protein RclHR1_09480001 [Rhizophagus clarus]|uniref:Uncharacterized protein n=1 Tax=Rhizophagus clarus TaxID=94130 RepID=A0A2Z6S6P3_9GLOM|nr:hypothetical protein RclHR1_09480001 [Rhizophagus clarus]